MIPSASEATLGVEFSASRLHFHREGPGRLARTFRRFVKDAARLVSYTLRTMVKAIKWAFGLALPVLAVLSSVLAQSQADTPAAAQARAEIPAVEALLKRVPDRAAVLYYLAGDYLLLGESQKALALLKECVAANEGFDPDRDPVFRPLYGDARFRSLVMQAEKQYPVVDRAQVAFSVPEKDLIPEGLAFDEKAQVFYLSSLFHKKIVRFGMDGKVSDFVPEGKYDLLPICGLRDEIADNSLWAAGCEDDGRGELYHFSADGSRLEHISPPTPGKHLFNDLVLRGNSEIYLTDSLANQVYRIERKGHKFTTLSFPRPLFYPNGITLSDDRKLLYVADAFGVFVFDLEQNTSHEVDRGPSGTLSGIDGLYWYKGDLVGVQNGIGVPRITQFSLAPGGLRVQQEKTLVYRSPQLGTTTTGAIRNSDFFFIENSQIDNREGNRILDPAKLEPVRIGKVALSPVP